MELTGVMVLAILIGTTCALYLIIQSAVKTAVKEGIKEALKELKNEEQKSMEP